MSQPDENTPPQKKRLTLQQCKQLLWMQGGYFLLSAGFGIHQLYERHFLFASLVLFAAVSQTFALPTLWKQYRLVKDGAVVYSNVQQSQVQMPQAVSIAVVFVLTVFAGFSSAFVVYVIHSYFNTQLGWVICGLTLLAVWLFIGYCWFRIITEKPAAKPITFQEQPEGVWPPAPTIKVEVNNKD